MALELCFRQLYLYMTPKVVQDMLYTLSRKVSTETSYNGGNIFYTKKKRNCTVVNISSRKGYSYLCFRHLFNMKHKAFVRIQTLATFWNIRRVERNWTEKLKTFERKFSYSVSQYFRIM